MTSYPRVDDTAPCRTGPPDRFFPTARTTPEDIAAVKGECRRCPFREPCLAWALTNEADGLWGATTATERRQMRKRLGVRKVAAPHLVVMPDRSVYVRKAS